MSRSGRDRPICSPEPCERLPPDTLLDGEMVAIDRDGRVSFNLLPNSRSKAAAIQFYAFDLMMYRGKSLLRVPLHVRRVLLAEALKGFGSKGSMRFSEAIEAPPEKLISVTKQMGFEGTGKRTGAWIKYKINKSQAFVIVLLCS